MSQLISSKLSFNLKLDKFDHFIQMVDDLSKISDIIKIKIDKDDILMYSMVGDSAILAFKSFLINTDQYFDLEEVDQLDLIVPGSKKFVKSLSLIKKSDKIKIDITYRRNDDGINIARFFEIKNGKFKLSQSCGEESEIRNIPKEALEQKLSLKNKKWSFSISKENFDDIRKLSNINSENKILSISVDGDGKVLLSEVSSWELEVDEVTVSNKNLMINKSYLSNIDNKSDISFHIFESFILIKDDISNLMVSFETQFED